MKDVMHDEVHNRWIFEDGGDTLTYYIDGYLRTMPNDVQDRIIQNAFDKWSAHVPIFFKRIMDKDEIPNVNIMIGVGRGSAMNFDGSGGTLAWAQMPEGDNTQLRTRFDLDELFIANPKQRGVLLLNVAVHEVGHILGLGHSKKNGAIMAPSYSAMISEPQEDDDIPLVQNIYPGGPAILPVPPIPTPGTPAPSPGPEPGPSPTGKQIVTITVQGKVLGVDTKNA
jgi:hypothetical protein